MTVVDGGTTEPGPYGVTVAEVRELATHIVPNASIADPDFGPRRGQITDPMIANWIRLVADSVATRVAMLSRFRDSQTRWGVIEGAARTAVVNGAASYLVAAAFPAKAGTNDQTSYSAELWRRYENELGLLVDLGPILDADDAAGGDGGVVESTGVMPIASANRPSVPDGSGFFATDPGERVFWDPNRMHPTRGGYPAPGAEGRYY